MLATNCSLWLSLVVGLGACSTAPRRASAPPAAKADPSPPDPTPPEPSARADEPNPEATAQRRITPPPSEPPSSELPRSEAATWIDPLPRLVLTELDEVQRARAHACLEGHDIGSPSARPASIMAAAECLSTIPAPGHEIRLYKHLLAVHPDAPEALEATRRLGTRLEQIDVRDRAVEAYASYLRRYPKQADARALGQRAVCLARSLGLEASVEALLSDLERLYGRRGFTRPSDAELEALCAPLPPLAPRSG